MPVKVLGARTLEELSLRQSECPLGAGGPSRGARPSGVLSRAPQPGREPRALEKGAAVV